MIREPPFPSRSLSDESEENTNGHYITYTVAQLNTYESTNVKGAYGTLTVETELCMSLEFWPIPGSLS